MTILQKEKILAMRENGITYSAIALELGLSENTVKSFGRRNSTPQNQPLEKGCLNCGKPLVQLPKKKMKKFCSDKCRSKWWNTNSHVLNKKAVYRFVCEQCGVDFEIYGIAYRRYCSRACYGLSRRTRNE